MLWCDNIKEILVYQKKYKRNFIIMQLTHINIITLCQVYSILYINVYKGRYEAKKLKLMQSNFIFFWKFKMCFSSSFSIVENKFTLSLECLLVIIISFKLLVLKKEFNW
jgi:hypothetical protein